MTPNRPTRRTVLIAGGATAAAAAAAAGAGLLQGCSPSHRSDDRPPDESAWPITIPGTKAPGRPVRAGDGIYSASTGAVLRAFDVTTGARRWSTTLRRIDSPGLGDPNAPDGKDVRVTDPTVVGNLVVTTVTWADTGILVAVDIKTGREVWRWKPSEPRHAPQLQPRYDNGLLLTTSGPVPPEPADTGQDTGQDTLRAFDPATGKEVWNYSRPRYRGFSWEAHRDAFVVTDSATDLVVGLHARTGDVLWTRRSTGSPVGVYGKAMLMVNAAEPGGAAAPSSEKTQVTSITAATGEVIWSKRVPGATRVRGGRLFAQTDEALSALEAATGRTLWSRKMRRLPGTSDDGDLITKDLWCLRDSSSDREQDPDSYTPDSTTRVIALDVRTGHQAWAVTVPRGSAHPRAITKETVYVAAPQQEGHGTDEALYSVDVRDGSIRWKRRVPQASAPEPEGTRVLITAYAHADVLDRDTGVPVR
ncbi:outer membrane protein assembly factor BamB family protein [Streptomyces boluensis]|uniref:PQQ-binding-like beta-propeller repeat protein n=1 Tax=Streptomyces boluensis TaxID=1775135 RepID=A0A964XKB3_9ACTN|nr:PQQ-binding-like beta-propeller repeat protein [Streptomyces boluensis]NBE50363.1 PQQ-binding-like beta-propeller repeat protein [Streptomyces boluensis]